MTKPVRPKGYYITEGKTVRCAYCKKRVIEFIKDEELNIKMCRNCYKILVTPIN